MPGYGGFAYGGLAYGGGGSGGSVPHAAFDSWTISDAATRQLTFARSAADSWTLADSATSITGSNQSAADSVSIGDSAARALGLSRTAFDSWTISDRARGVHVPYIDQPTHLMLKGDIGSLVLRPGDAMALSPGTATLQLQSGAATNTLDAELRGLALKDEQRGLWTDG